MEIINKLPKVGTVVIVGYAATGKTFLTTQIEKSHPKAAFWHTDDLINQYDFEEALYVLMPKVIANKNPLKIIEGIQGHRLLRKGLQLKTFYADVVVVCQASKEVRAKRIADRGKDINRTFGQDKGLDKIWNDYLTLLKTAKKKPEIIYHDTN